MVIPDWTARGVLPPVDEAEPVSHFRSPYRATLSDLVIRFGSSLERCTILEGWLRYRQVLHRLGLVTGFQWLDGSFLEDVETLESRPPNDIDCVTFYRLEDGRTEQDLYDEAADMFDHSVVKRDFRVDAYSVNLAYPSQTLIAQSAYWYSVWSHRRDLMWKGFVQIDLDPSEDEFGREYLASQNWAS